MIFENDDDVCPKCGAYWQNTGNKMISSVEALERILEIEDEWG